MTMTSFKRVVAVFAAIASLASTAGCVSTAPAINNEADQAVNVFREQVNGADLFLNQAAGYLVFPRVIKAGAGIGGETGEGVLRVGGSTVAYYRTTSGSIGCSPSCDASRMWRSSASAPGSRSRCPFE